MARVLAIACSILLISSAALAADATSKPAAGDGIVGWRGDGTGRYPNATPPKEWSFSESGKSKNILWKTKLPSYSWGTPVIVGDKVFTFSEPYDLICLDKKSGKPLWIRSHPPFVAVTTKEREANSAWNEVAQLVADLQKANDEFVAKGWSKELYTKKHDLQVKVNDLTAKADAKYTIPPDMYCESWSGYTGQTPSSDGKFIYFTSGVGVTGCYDLDGKLKWTHYEQIPAKAWGEHGCGMSPTVFKDRFLVPIMWNLVIFDKKSGKELSRYGFKQGSGAVAIIPFERNGGEFALAIGNFVNLKDGTSYFAQQYTDTAPVIDGDLAFMLQPTGRIGWHKFEPAGNGLKVTPMVNGDNYAFKIPIKDEKDRWDPMKNYWVSSPLYHDGLVYSVSCWGHLVVMDVKTAQMVYEKYLPLEMPQSRKSFGMGMGASPALAGKYIFITSSIGSTIVMEPGREYKQVAQNNIDYTVPEGWEVRHWTGPHHEQFEASPIFDGSRIYLRGEQFLYCVGGGNTEEILNAIYRLKQTDPALHAKAVQDFLNAAQIDPSRAADAIDLVSDAKLKAEAAELLKKAKSMPASQPALAN